MGTNSLRFSCMAFLPLMALLPPFYLDAVVALGIPDSNGSIQYTATGFLYGHPVGESGDNYTIFLITNHHVVKDIDILKARFNRPIGSESKIYDIPLRGNDGSALWTEHPNSDVAVVQLLAKKLEEDGIKFAWIPGDRQLALEQAKELQISEGDGVFVLGFPLGLAGEERNYTIVRQGVIARIRDWLGGKSRTILIDATIFPGNSGGPVFTRPEIAAVKGTKSNKSSLLIGMISSYIPYEDVAISSRTHRARIIFQENSGLATVVPVDVIQETIDRAVKKLRRPRK